MCSQAARGPEERAAAAATRAKKAKKAKKGAKGGAKSPRRGGGCCAAAPEDGDKRPRRAPAPPRPDTPTCYRALRASLVRGGPLMDSEPLGKMMASLAWGDVSTTWENPLPQRALESTHRGQGA